MSIDLKTIKHISKLSRISVDEKKAEKLAWRFKFQYFDFIEKLNEIKN
jgi:Asp-tRNAAsn/Glu-tRNAGln amidotransferase C subunit